MAPPPVVLCVLRAGLHSNISAVPVLEKVDTLDNVPLAGSHRIFDLCIGVKLKAGLGKG